MKLIQRYLPNPRHAEIHRAFVKASPAVAWEKIRHFDMGQVPWVRLLFDIRTLPDRVTGKLAQEDRRIGLDQIEASASGFHILEEISGSDIIVGAIGKFWVPAIPFTDVAPGEFVNFQKPGYGKLAWSITVVPYQEGSVITLELRISATDAESWQKFSRYYKLIGPPSRLIRTSLMKHLETSLGKLVRPDIEARALPGDERLLHCHYQLTHETDIEAPAALVWRYLMQLGCDRAGWYSIDALDHGGAPSIDHLVSGWETRAPGDRLKVLPDDDGYFEVFAVDPEKNFIVGGDYTIMKKPYHMSWAFVLEPVGEDTTHLITRARMELEPPVLEWIWGNLVAYPAHTIMQKAQLRNLKKICERDARAGISESTVV